MTSRPRLTWTNWARTETAHPASVVSPSSTEEVAAVVRAATAGDLRIKPVGSGHSFTGIAVTDGVQLRMDRMRRLLALDATSGLVTVQAGIDLHDLDVALAGCGLALENLGDIDSQTVSGAISTGTHGTGARLGGLATQVRALQMVLADGSVVTASAQEQPELFAAARVGLGALGVITEVTLACVPAFLLRAVERPEPLDAVLGSLDASALAHDHFELYWFPHTARVQTKRNDRVAPGTRPQPVPPWRRRLDDELLANTVFEGLNRLATRRPALVPAINAVAARALTAREYVAPSHDVFTSPRRVVFRECEYAVPRESVGHVITELRAWVDTHDERIPFPVEVRFAVADDIWLSTAHERDSAYVAVHQYHRLAHERWFSAFETIAADVGGRPHWGKIHSRTATELRDLYPRFDDFTALRDRLDPGRVFANPYLERVLGR